MKETFNKKTFKNHIVYAGTNVVSASSDSKEPVLGLVLNTGFLTTKGKLARTVLFNEENNATNQKESYFLLMILLVVSIVASVYVMIMGLQDEERNKNKLFLRCIGIVTSVVPPELPMIMTMAINNSLLYLKKKRIFCTDPKRMGLAGKVQTCVFDKTGTLTQENLIFKGISVYDEEKEEMTLVEDLRDQRFKKHEETSMILGGCQSVVDIDGKLNGDPIEMIFFENSDWGFQYSQKQAFHKKDPSKQIKIRNTFFFNSELKRMSTIIQTTKFSLPNQYFLVTKGAPEIIGSLLSDKPKKFNDWYKDLAI